MRLFDLSSSGFMFRRSLHRQESRVLSIAWHPSGENLVTGGMDSTLRIINVSSALCMQRISLDDYKEKSTLVWDVKFIDNSSMVTADSLGKVQVWDCKYGTLESTFNHHLADVLTLTVQAGENGNINVFASGVDSKIVKMSRISTETEEESKGTEWKWILSGQNRPHQHDVSSLDVSSTGLLASGGIEGQLVITSCNHFSQSTYIKQQPFPCMARHLKVAEKGNMLLYQDVSAVSIWHVSEPCLAHSSMTNTKKREASHKNMSSFDFNTSVEKHAPLCLLQLKAKPPHNILSSAISEDGTLMAVSNCDEMWIYGFNAQTLQLRLLANLHDPSFAMCFMPSQQEILLATIHDGLKRVTFDACGHIEAGLVLKDMKKSIEQIKHFELSADGQLLAAITWRWRVLVVDLVTGSLIAKLPKLQSLPLVCTFNPVKPELLIFAGGESRELFVYSVADDCLRCFGRVRKGGKGEVYEGRTKFSHPIAIIPISFEEGLFAVYDNDCAIMFRLTSNSVQDLAKPSQKPQKRSRPHDTHLPAQLIKSASLVLFVGVFSASHQKEKKNCQSTETEIEAGTENKQGLIIVERCWRDVLQALPPTLYRKRFGT